TFETADGYLNIACLNQKLWREFCETIDRPDLLTDDRFETNADRVQSMDALEEEIEDTLTERTSDEWMDLFMDAGIPAGPVQDVEEALYNEQTNHRDVIHQVTRDDTEIPVIEHPLNFDNVNSGFASPPPTLGEHNREVLKEVGYTDEEITELANSGIFGEMDDSM
ncbi:MAG: CoA transferase, partial [Halobacteriaceae archaeon]